MLVHRRRQWPNNKTALTRRLAYKPGGGLLGSVRGLSGMIRVCGEHCCLVLGRSLRCWPNMNTSLAFAGDVWGLRRRLRSKHQTFSQGCFNVGPPSATLAQHWNNLGWTSRVYTGCACGGVSILTDPSRLSVHINQIWHTARECQEISGRAEAGAIIQGSADSVQCVLGAYCSHWLPTDGR